jgi:hypothetical protein
MIKIDSCELSMCGVCVVYALIPSGGRVEINAKSGSQTPCYYLDNQNSAIGALCHNSALNLCV